MINNNESPLLKIMKDNSHLNGKFGTKNNELFGGLTQINTNDPTLENITQS